MTYKFFPHTEEDLKEMLAKAGVSSLEELYAEVPESIRFKGDYDLPEAMSELEIRQLFDPWKAQQTTCLLCRCRYLRPLYTFGYTKYHPTLGIPHVLHSLPG